MALRGVLLKITGDPSDAKRALAEAAADLKRLDGLEANARVVLKDEAVKAQIEIVKARLERLGQQEATPKVTIAMGRALDQLERLESKLSHLDGKDVTVDVNVNRKGEAGALARDATAVAGGVAGGVAGAVGAIGSVASAATAGIPALSRLIELGAGIGPAIVVGLAVALPFLAALISSFAAAAAGAAALGVALAGALGPVALVGIVAVAKLVGALKSVKAHSDGAASAAHQQASAAAAIQSAQDGVRTSTRGLADAQSNLGEQAVAANRAWQDSIEAVKDDLLGVQHAQLGIEDANLSLREAQQALKDFRGQAGLAGKSLDAVFSKFTDVAVDTSGLKKAIADAAGASSGAVSGDDQLKLERLILNVREAKLHEKDATDQLHDSNVALRRDRSTEADFAKRGIAAYGPYRQAVEGVTTAQRALTASTRQLAQAQRQSRDAASAAADVPAAPTGALAGLIESIDHIKKKIGEVFGPALNAIFAGASKGMDEFSKSFRDPRMKGALTDIGKAIGGVFIAFGKLFSNKEFRDGFVKLAEGGAKLVTILGKKVFVDFATLLLRIAVAALPDLVSLVSRLADKLHLFVASTRDGEKFRKKIHDLIDETKTWVHRIVEVGKTVVNIIEFFTDLYHKVKRYFEAFTNSAHTVNRALKSAFGDAIDWIVDKFNAIKDIGSKVGKAIASGFNKALNGFEKGAKAALNAVIGVLNFFIGKINDVTPGDLKIAGHTVVPGIPDVPKIPRLAAGGIALRDTLARIGEAGREAVLPLTTNVLRQLGLAIHAATIPALGGGGLRPAFAGAGGFAGTHIDSFHTHILAPAGELPDVQTTASALSRLMESRAGGSPRD